MQSFRIWLRHMSETKNIKADWLSRISNHLQTMKGPNSMNKIEAEVICWFAAAITIGYEQND